MDATTHQDADTKSDTRHEDPDEISAKKPKAPLWSDESDSGRVRASIWSHDRKSGKPRYSVGICRSYLDKDDDRWVNTFYYDPKDLDDVIAFAQEAKKKLARLQGEQIPE
jgi:hypothetical protein